MNMNTRRQSSQPSRTVTHMARGLGWFSIALGLSELLMPRKTSRATGLRGSEPTVRAYGAREIATGIGLLASRDPTPWLWARVGGDALDIATLATSAAGGRERDLQRAVIAIVAVAGVTALDIVCAEAARRDKQRATQAQRDYSDRSGFPLPPQEMRGVALEDFEADADMRAPAALRPYTSSSTPAVVEAAAQAIGLR
jgi:hypothetical protein